jgi:hypothetical protein
LKRLASSKCFVHIRALVSDLRLARRRGVKVGRPRKLTDHHLAHARALLDAGTKPEPASPGCSVSTRRHCGGRSI